MLLRCEDMCSSQFGRRYILPYGPNNTYKSVPDHPISPTGMAGNMCSVESTMTREEMNAK